METISVAITDSSNMCCFYWYLCTYESGKAEGCTDIMFKLTLYCLSTVLEDLNLYL